MKILANATVTKLKEYRQSYGGREFVAVPFIKETDNTILLIDAQGRLIREMRKGTKVLISWCSDQEITERAFKIRTNKAIKAATALMFERAKQSEAEIARRKAIADVQLKAWQLLLIQNPDKTAKYITKMAQMASSKWRNLLRLKAAKHINNGSFEGLEVSASELRDVLVALPS